MFLLAAISLGFLGSFHCVGMCGPIALAIPVKRNSPWNLFFGTIIYNSGRIFTYSIMGLFFGTLGKSLVIAGGQNILSVILGLAILLMLLLPKSYSPTIRVPFFYRGLEKLKSGIRKLFGVHTKGSLFLIGTLNGLLPCGLVYLGVTGSIATGDALRGSLFMAAFGLGTLPAMTLISFIRDFIGIRFRENIRKTVPLFVGTMALLLVLRGMNLGIPFISPLMDNDTGKYQKNCCHK